MIKTLQKGWPLLLAAVCVFTIGPVSRADVISDGSGAYSMGIDGTWGNVFSNPPYIGFVRNADGFDPSPPALRKAWGVAAGGVAGFADPSAYGSSNITSGVINVSNGSVFNITNTLNAGSGDLLSITQNYSFLAANVVQIAVSITNVSGVAQAVTFARNVDFDVAPTPFNEIINVGPHSSPVTAASFSGFENPSPLAPFSSNAGGGGLFGPSDLGTGFQLDLGVLGAATNPGAVHLRPQPVRADP